MREWLSFVIGIAVLALGIPIGEILARFTKDELEKGQPWFKLIILLSLAGALVSAIISNDAFLFAFLFMAIVTSRSLSAIKTRRRTKK